MIVFKREYIDKNYSLGLSNSIIAIMSDSKPIQDDCLPQDLNFKSFRQNMTSFRIIRTALQREDKRQLQEDIVPKYISGAAYEAYFNYFKVRI